MLKKGGGGLEIFSYEHVKILWQNFDLRRILQIRAPVTLYSGQNGRQQRLVETCL